MKKEEYEKILKDNEEGSKTNDYSKMIMMGDDKDLACKKYLRDNDLCTHTIVEDLSGGRRDRCIKCGKTWG